MTSATFVFLLAVGGQAPARFEVRTLAGEPAVGAVQTVGTDGSLTLPDGIKVAAGDWYSLRRSAAVLPAWPRGPHAELTNGDRVVGTVAAADGDVLRLRLSLAGEPDQTIRFPVSSLRAVWVTNRPADAPDPEWLTGPRKRDVILSRNGDVAMGALIAIDPGDDAVRYQADGRDQQLKWAAVAAIGFNTDLARVRRPKGPFYRLTLADGTRLSVTSVAFDGQTWTAVTPFKDTLRVPHDHLVSVDVEQGKVTYLSDLKPTTYQYQPFEGEEYSWVADRAVTGRPMTLKTGAGESTFDRGVGLHAECTVTYSLGGKYRRFETTAGLDARSGMRGDAEIAVLVDGKEQPLPNPGRLSNATGSLAVRIDVTGAKELKITARRGAGGNVQDHVNLAEARLVP